MFEKLHKKITKLKKAKDCFEISILAHRPSFLVINDLTNIAIWKTSPGNVVEGTPVILQIFQLNVQVEAVQLMLLGQAQRVLTVTYEFISCSTNVKDVILVVEGVTLGCTFMSLSSYIRWLEN